MRCSVRPRPGPAWPGPPRATGSSSRAGGGPGGPGDHRSTGRARAGRPPRPGGGAGREPVPGLLAYDGDEPVGWVGLGPRSGFERLVRSRFLAPVDDLPAWSIVCFFVARRRRGQGVARALLEGAGAYAREHGAPAVEGYARDPGDRRLSTDAAYTGTVSLFRAAGFHEAAVGDRKS